MNDKEPKNIYFILKEEGGYIRKTVSRAGMFISVEDGEEIDPSLDHDVEALWWHEDTQYRVSTILFKSQVPYIQIVSEEEAWALALKVGM